MTPKATIFTWLDEPIPDIVAWAQARGERMVDYRADRTVLNPCTGQLETETHTGTMPESFWNSLRMDGGWMYREIS